MSTALVVARADLDLGHRRGQLGRELVGDVGVCIEAVRRGAGLGAVTHLGHHCTFDCSVDIGVFENDERRVAAQLHDGLQYAVGRSAKQLATDAGRAGERHHASCTVFHCGIKPGTRITRWDHVDESGWHACGLAQLSNAQCGERCLCRRLDNDRIASSQCGRELAGDHRRGEVPRRNHDNNAHRRVLHQNALIATGGERDRTVDPHGFLGVPSKELGCVADFADGVGSRLAVLGHDQVG